MDLEDLLIGGVDLREERLSRQELFEVLASFISIHTYPNDPYSISVSESFDELSARDQVIVAFLTMEALFRLDREASYFTQPNELWGLFDGVEAGSHYPFIRNLEQEGVLDRTDGRGYAIKTEALSSVVEGLNSS